MSQNSMLRRRRAIRRGLVLLLIAVLAVAAILFFYGTRDKTPVVRAAAIGRGDITSIMYLTAQLKPGAIQEVSVGRQLVETVAVKVGDQVRQGDTLITFDLSELEEQLEEARRLRQETEDAISQMTGELGDQAASAQKAMQNLQYQINKLSGNIAGSFSALNNLTGLPPYTLSVDQAAIDELTVRLQAVDRDAPDAAGQYEEILRSYGDTVRVVASDDYQKQLDKLRASLNGASSATTGLLSSVANPDLLTGLTATSGAAGMAQSAQSLLSQAVQAELMAENALNNAVGEIVAEFDGLVAQVNAIPGTYTAPEAASSLNGLDALSGLSGLGGLASGSTTKVLVLYDNVRPVATYQANRYDASRLAVGMPVTYHQEGRDYYGEVSYKSRFATSVDPAGSADSLFGGMGGVGGLTSEPALTVDMTVRGDDLSHLVLGFNIDAEVQTAFAQNVLLLPAEAMKRELGVYYVFVLEADGRLRRQPISPGIQSDTHVEVKEGLAEGDRVVLGPANDLTDGILVEEGPVT
ncbi:MAG: biotin/lipoyl-binding protein [Clostridiaceae bacterium]|nr:biotin/lipoyl-binding protein [Clostridiaceae bacterium]